MAVLLLCAAAPAAAAGARAPCPQAQGTWQRFACRFLTVDRWEAAGRPLFVAPDGSRWQPWFYGDRADGSNNIMYEGRPFRARRAGRLEALQKLGTLPDPYDPAYVARYWDLYRYLPWSVYLMDRAGCRPGQSLDPQAAARLLPRTRLLGLGWAEYGSDAADPTRRLGPDALPALRRDAEEDTGGAARGRCG